MLSGKNLFKPGALLLQKLDYDHFDKIFWALAVCSLRSSALF
jgi:hypothetical protein